MTTIPNQEKLFIRWASFSQHWDSCIVLLFMLAVLLGENMGLGLLLLAVVGTILIIVGRGIDG